MEWRRKGTEIAIDGKKRKTERVTDGSDREGVSGFPAKKKCS